MAIAFAAIAAMLCTLMFFGMASATIDNLVTNGDFSDNLNGWSFSDTSDPSCWQVQAGYPLGYSEAIVEAGRAKIHQHGCCGSGELTQDFSEHIIPSYFKFDQEEIGHTCEWIAIDLRPVFSYRVGGQDTHPNFANSCFLGQSYHYASNDPSYNKGTVELYFDYDSQKLDVYMDSVYKNSFNLPAKEDMTAVTGVRLRGSNPCCDWRIDSYGYLDNVILTATSEPIPEFTTIAIPVAAILALVFLMSRRSRHSKRRN